MANPTTNYAFAMPTNTDLVKDLPADFEIFGQAVDTKIKDLNPETTAGDISYRGSTANAKTRLAIGTAGQVLKVNSGATAPEWGTVSSGLTLLTNAAFTTVSSYSLPNSTFSSTYTNYLIVLDITAFSANNTFIARMRSSGSDYTGNQYLNQRISGFGATIEASSGATNTSIDIGADVNSNTNYQLRLELYKPNANVKKWFLSQQWFYDSAGNNRHQLNAGRIDQSTQYDSLSIIPSTGTMTGRIFCYGYAA